MKLLCWYIGNIVLLSVWAMYILAFVIAWPLVAGAEVLESAGNWLCDYSKEQNNE